MGGEPLRLVIKSGPEAGRSVELTREEIIVGRDELAGLVLGDEQASRSHAAFAVGDDDQVTVRDLGSTNGTFLDGRRVAGSATVEPGSEIAMGDSVLVVERPGAGVGEAMVVVDATVTAGATEASGGVRRRPVPVPPGRLPAPQAPVPGGSLLMRLPRRLRQMQIALAAIGALALVGIALAVLFATGAIGGGSDGNATPPPANSVASAAALAARSTVLVTTYHLGERRGNGTGWVLDAKQGLIVTNAHVVNGGEVVDVRFGDKEQRARFVAVAPCEDVALLKIQDTTAMRSMTLGSQSALAQGQQVVAVGYPGSASRDAALTTTSGVVSVVKTTWDVRALDVPFYPNVVQTDAAINPGNSGGPLIALDGSLVGMNSAGLGARQNQGFAIGVDRLKEVTAGLRGGTSPGWLGLGFHYPRTAAELRDLGFPDVPGIVITHAVPGTPADEAEAGDRLGLLTRVNGKPVSNSLQGYCEAIGNAQTGDRAFLTIVGAGQATPATVKVAYG